ncbi:Lrp/AsnC family transcriptional regulator [Undibacterium sp.]|uniref:Lrp/AsnC family transcriptional regulator n=1 Tax=Undibacterium sp. TaxID=1914977 RepID=UPI00374D3CC2
MKIELDQMDGKILEILQEDARVTLAEIGRRIHLSQPAVAERVRRMEAANVITGYHARVNPAALGYGMTAFVRVAPHSDYRALAAAAQQLSGVVECHSLTGDDFIVKAVVPSVQELEQLLTELTRHGGTSTSLVLTSPVERRSLKPLSS